MILFSGWPVLLMSVIFIVTLLSWEYLYETVTKICFIWMTISHLFPLCMNCGTLCFQTTKRLVSKPQDALKGIILRVSKRSCDILCTKVRVKLLQVVPSFPMYFVLIAHSNVS